jgi:hypothetical protein
MSSLLRDLCVVCFQVVYASDKVTFEGATYHRNCMKAAAIATTPPPPQQPLQQQQPASASQQTASPITSPADLFSTSGASSDEEDAAEHIIGRLASTNRRPTRTGWMVKRGAVVKNWKKRFCVLVADSIATELRYYRAGQLDSPRGTIDLTAVLSVSPVMLDIGKVDTDFTGTLPGIALVTPKRRWLFACETERDRRSWLETFTSVCHCTS